MASTDLVPSAHRPAAEGLVIAAPRLTAQAAIVAAGGLVAGAATVAMVRRRRSRPVRARTRNGRGSSAGRPIVASRSFIVDVHLLGRGN